MHPARLRRTSRVEATIELTHARPSPLRLRPLRPARAAARAGAGPPRRRSPSTRRGPVRAARRTPPRDQRGGAGEQARLKPWTNALLACATSSGAPSWCRSPARRRASRGAVGEPGRQAAVLVRDARAVRAVQHAAEHGDPERAAELARDVVDRRRDALLLARQRGDDRGRRRRAGERHAGAEREQAGEELPVGRADVERARGRGSRSPSGRARSAPVTRTPTRPAIFGATRESGMTTSAIGSSAADGLQRRVARARAGGRAARGRGTRTAAKNCTEIESEPAPKPRRRKLRGSSIGSRRRSSQTTKSTIPASAAERAPPASAGSPQPRSGALDDPEDERRERDDRDQRADRVEPRRPRLAGRRDDRERAGERDRGEDDVEREDRRPGEPLAAARRRRAGR